MANLSSSSHVIGCFMVDQELKVSSSRDQIISDVRPLHRGYFGRQIPKKNTVMLKSFWCSPAGSQSMSTSNCQNLVLFTFC